VGIFRHRRVRCFNCGLDYRRTDNQSCPRCGEARVIKGGAWFPTLHDGSAGMLGMQNTQAGHAVPDMQMRDREQARYEADHRNPTDQSDLAG
jgi:hypothetical protein